MAASKKQKTAARENIKKAQQKWQSMSVKARSHAQPTGHNRAKPGTKGEGDYYHITVREKYQFTDFRTHDVGRAGHSLRVAGKRANGSWSTQKWLINKSDAFIDEQGYLRANNDKTKKILQRLGSVPRHKKADLFIAKPRYNVPEKNKPTPAQKEARKKNIKKAQKARNK